MKRKNTYMNSKPSSNVLTKLPVTLAQYEMKR